MMEATIFCSPGKPAGERYGLYIGAWNDPDRITLDGFATNWEAWAFCICNGMNDPLPDTPANRFYTRRPPSQAVQLEMLA